jgi:hypothetical protein
VLRFGSLGVVEVVPWIFSSIEFASTEKSTQTPDVRGITSILRFQIRIKLGSDTDNNPSALSADPSFPTPLSSQQAF